ncbi:MAG: 6-phosphogluconolactonase [Verrucomicrobiota bacterium]
MRPLRLPLTCLPLLLACLCATTHGADHLVYFGTYTGKSSKGIYASRLEAATGRLTPPELVAETRSPSFLALAPNGKSLYAVSEISTFEGKPAGAVSAFRIERPTGTLTALNQVSSGGGAPCHLTVDASGRTVLVANYSGGSVAALAVREDGSLAPGSVVQHTGSSVNKSRQQGPHGHYISPDPANRFALACDLGLDQVLVYQLDAAKAGLTPHTPPHATLPPGSGPRHLAFRPDGRFAYVINEMTCTMTTFGYDADRGVLQRRDTLSTLPAGESVKPSFSTAEVEVHPSGKFLYGSNRGHDTIAVFAINPADGSLRLVEHVGTRGRTPRSFGIDPTGRWLLAANQSSDTVVVFRIDPDTGKLTPTGQEITVGAPVCVKFLPLP